MCVCVHTEHGIPTSVDFIGCDPAHMVTSFSSGDIVTFDLETSQPTLVLHGQGDTSRNYRAFSVASPALPSGIHSPKRAITDPTAEEQEGIRLGLGVCHGGGWV